MKVAPKTLNLEMVRGNPALFRYGVVRRFHQIDIFTIVEFENSDAHVGFLAYCGLMWADTVDASLERALLRALTMNHHPTKDVEPIVHVLGILLRV